MSYARQSRCRRCNVLIVWAVEGSRWVPVDPTSLEPIETPKATVESEFLMIYSESRGVYEVMARATSYVQGARHICGKKYDLRPSRDIPGYVDPDAFQADIPMSAQPIALKKLTAELRFDVVTRMQKDERTRQANRMTLLHEIAMGRYDCTRCFAKKGQPCKDLRQAKRWFGKPMKGLHLDRTIDATGYVADVYRDLAEYQRQIRSENGESPNGLTDQYVANFLAETGLLKKEES